ncbi:MAG: hypothetical protein LBI13_03440 [Streptococcaceae bacterium]|jgi:hypothetical protein|nr:hypothetical protein [Streptococcaceae bacterium]
MPKDINANERLELGLKIQHKENDIDTLYQEKENYQRDFRKFQSSISAAICPV